MNRFLTVLTLLAMTNLLAVADSGVSTNEPREILARTLANRPEKDFELKARFFASRDPAVPLEILVKNAATEVRTLYKAGSTELLVIALDGGEVRYYLRGTGELTGDQRMGKFLNSSFSYYDLGVPFLRWTAGKDLGEDRIRGRDCYLVETMAVNEPYARVKMWIDKEYAALLRAEAYDANGSITKRFAITSFKKIDNVWVPKGLEVAFVPHGQTLPAQEKSRLEIYDGNYDAKLPDTQFDVGRFTAAASIGK